MNVYIAVGTTEKFDVSGYCIKIGNSSTILKGKHVGWTVVESALHGFLAASEFIIRNKLYDRITAFTIVTQNNFLSNLFDEKSDCNIYKLKSYGWQYKDGSYLMHKEILKEILLHREFYRERNITWDSNQNITKDELLIFEIIITSLENLLGEKQKHFL